MTQADNNTEKDIISRKNIESERFVSIDFNDVDLTVFIKFISELTGKNFVIDDKIRGKVTIISPAKISVEEAYKVFESVLEVHGYATVQAGEIIKIVSSPEARTKNIETKLKEEAGSPDDKIVTQLIPLSYADPNEIKRLFTPLISKNSVILAYPPTNMLIVTDVYSNIVRLLQILKPIDVKGIGQEISLIPLEFADAAKLINLLSTVFQSNKKTKKSATEQEVKFVADERTNTIVLLASEDDTSRIKKLIEMLDKETPRGQGKIRVYYLEFATAEEMVKVLQEVPQKQGDSIEGKKAPVVSDKVKITADKATNSLIITADADDYLVLEEIIKKLDIPRSMVYIEALIMEVNVDKNFQVGVEWLAGGKTSVDNNAAIIGGGFGGGTSGGDTGYLNLTAPLAAAASELSTGTSAALLPSGFSLGLFGESLKIGNLYFPNIGAIIQAYQKDKDIHILSTPQILTTDNEEAKINVGKNIPYQTRTSTSENDTYNSFEYKDVGKTLKITPHISKDRLVRMNISLEVTDLESTEDFRPTTLKRTVDTTVIVKDNHTVVIGGLIDDSFSAAQYRVPCLGDIPVLSWLFKSMANSNSKTNLFVFITPRVIKDPVEAEEIYRKKKSQIDTIEAGQIKMYKTNTDQTN
ncbi:MAG: type II secretion system secretin GspD [Desulfobacterales bacterium]|nr:type II secretion system secretin GspD [Desulfobacterales bacterium]